MDSDMKPKFDLGREVMTRGIATRASESTMRYQFLFDCLASHASGDWGDLDQEDKDENEAALIHGNRVMSAYKTPEVTIWVITEADRSVTTILFPEDY